ncbi:RTA1 like protein [Hypoxylon fragiforme]|uniref:RTA1 like protein n=1 Tax=Hypoxylon fragiforme TaxID=63214 RepID=UPI0020C5B862|nr:RTA1 like protein [Hypoxylon fragiforme]KAI2604736.1 RTA1 like protein [Hypoxylon fragiforme]
MVQLEPYKGGYYLWKYLPSIPAAIIFAIIFAALTGIHTYRLFKTKLWFCLPFIIGGIMEVIGYCARAVAYSHTGQLPVYIVQNLMILLPPLLFAASIYMVLGRIIRAVRGESYSLIRVGILTKVFVAGDVISFWVQGGGAGLMAKGDSAAMGEKIIVGGLIIQLLMFGLFIVTAVLFQTRYQREKVDAILYEAVGWKASMYMLYGVSILIMIRSIFRVIEFATGQNGYLLSNEWTLYVFDSVLMAAVMLIFIVWYPNNLRPSHQSLLSTNSAGTDIHLAEQGQNEFSDVALDDKGRIVSR